MPGVRAGFAGFLGLLGLLSLTFWAVSDQGGHPPSPYTGFETRAVKSLSAEDLDDLREGAGWGLALAAELNGAPGPGHLLELKDEIGLTPEQVTAIETEFTEMQAEAQAAGARFIAAETVIENAFRAGNADGETLRALIASAEAARAELRFIHLSRHLSMPPLLTSAQIADYARLRGYTAGDPCADIPEGHSAQLWRRHNGCS